MAPKQLSPSPAKFTLPFKLPPIPQPMPKSHRLPRLPASPNDTIKESTTQRPSLAGDRVLVRTTASSVCGTTTTRATDTVLEPRSRRRRKFPST